MAGRRTFARVLASAAIAWFAVPVPVGAATPTAPFVQADAKTARVFVQFLYDRYRHDELFSVLNKEELRYFDPSTHALIDENTRLLNGREGALGNTDPLCVCGDPGVTEADIRDVHLTGTMTASALVFVRYHPAGDEKPSRVELSLLFVGGNWRIHDVSVTDNTGRNLGGWRANLIRENQSLAQAGHR